VIGAGVIHHQQFYRILLCFGKSRYLWQRRRQAAFLIVGRNDDR
jgi:hypothetical protein